MIILFLIYDILFTIGFILYLPIYIFRKKINSNAIWEKFGFIKGLTFKKSIWIQAVSVGEANLIGNLIKRLRKEYDHPIVISTTTLTGNKIAKAKYSQIATVIFFPLDISFVLSKVLKAINPKIFIAVETEIWPNLFHRLNKNNIPIVIVNGRISDKAYRRYKMIKPLIKKVINKCGNIGVQNKIYKERFVFLGADLRKIVISGNMKFESISINEDKLDEIKSRYIPLLKRENKLLLIAASTHSPEEEIIINIYKEISELDIDLTLLIAPRHPERISSVQKVVSLAGFTPIKISQAFDVVNVNKGIFIVDTIGELLYFYSIADVCFVGGSLSGDGGHNILEPIYFLKPTIFGPDMSNFQDIEEVVLEKGAGVKARDSEELKDIILRFVSDEALRSNLHRQCRNVFEEEKKGLDKNLQIIFNALGKPKD